MLPTKWDTSVIKVGVVPMQQAFKRRMGSGYKERILA